LDNTSLLIDGVVAAYNFDGDVTDAKNNTYDGTNNGTTDVAGVVDRGRNFDGTNDFIETIDGISLGQKNSFSFFYTPGQLPASPEVLFCQAVATVGFADITYSLWRDTAGTISVYISSGSSWLYSVVGPTSLTPGTTYHVSLTVDSSVGMVLYVNGAIYSSSSSTGTINSEIVSLSLGRYGDYTGASDRYSDMKMDIFINHKRKISLTEVNALYNAGAGVQFPFSTSTPEPEPSTDNSLFYGGGL
jgi:hypothetical protein